MKDQESSNILNIDELDDSCEEHMICAASKLSKIICFF